MEYEQLIAPLLRGIYLHQARRSVIVLRGDTPVEVECLIDLGSAFQNESYNETMAAKIVSEACAAWFFEHGPRGVEAQRNQGSPTSLPSCVNVQMDSGTYTYWIDWDLDSCQRRARDLDQTALALPDPDLGTGTPSDPYRVLFTSRTSVVAGKIALVTGGAQGFGEELVRGLVAGGALVFIADLNHEGAKALADRLNGQQGRTVALPVACNVADEESVRELFAQVVLQAGGLDICVSNAGILKAGSVLDQDAATFRLVTEVNYTGFFLVTKYASRILRAQALTAQDWYTDIIQINSKSGLEGSNRNGAYAGSKFGGIGLVQSFAMELVNYHIKVNAICPGNFFDGPLWSDPEKGLFVQYLKAGKVPGAKTVADVRSFYEAKVPMKRGCTGPDVLKALYYIIEQQYETGQAVPVTGGQVMLH